MKLGNVIKYSNPWSAQGAAATKQKKVPAYGDNSGFQKAAKANAGDKERSSYYKDLQRQYDQLAQQRAGTGGSSLWGSLTGGNDRRKATQAEIAAQMSALESLLTKSGAAFGALDNQDAPTLSPQMLARLQALEGESQASSLAEDPLFQGDRAMLVSGGANALASLGSAQKSSRFGTGGAGSMQDTYDRLGTQLSQLGQESRKVKEQKRDVVAESYQSYDDAVRDFENNQRKAEAAIISGNLDQAYSFMEKATQAEVNMRNAQAQFQQGLTGNVLNAGLMAGAYAMGSPVAPQVPQQNTTWLDPYMTAGIKRSMPPSITPVDLDPTVPTRPVSTYRR